MRDYIDGAILEAVEKANVLMEKIPGATLGVHFEQLSSKAERQLEDIIASLHYLLEDSTINQLSVLKEKFDRFKLLSQEIATLENVVIIAMTRSESREETYVNKLVETICKEINYPLVKPVVSCLAHKRDHYHIYPHHNLLCVPLLESDFLLHLPDIYHELGHPLVETENRKAKGFKDQLGLFGNRVTRHFDDQISRKQRNGNGEDIIDYYRQWKLNWTMYWNIEFFCDLFGIFTLGPAFAWSHLHLCAKLSADVYRIPFFATIPHPPDDARMSVMLKGLYLMGYYGDSQIIGEKWTEFKNIVQHPVSQYYDSAIPESLMETLCNHVLEATKSVGCRIAMHGNETSIGGMLNNAWTSFWNDPVSFNDWEKRTVQLLYKEWDI